MINILFLHAGAEMYGADKILLQLVSGLDKSRFNPIVVLPNDGVLVSELKKKGITTYVINYPILRRKYFNFKGILKYISSFASSCKKIKAFFQKQNIEIDILHVNTTAVLEGIILKKMLNAKLVWHIHEILLKPKFVVSFLSFLIGCYADKCVAVSEAVKNNLIKSPFISNKMVKVIYNGVDSSVFSPKKNSDYLYQDFGIPRNAIKVGMIGRINSWKGQEDFLHAVSPLLDKFPNLYAIIIGSAFKGEEWRVQHLLSNIKDEKNSNRIIYSEYREDNAQIHNFFDIFVLPSTNPDPLPTVVLESMASEKPIVGYNHGGIKEMVVNKYNGFLVDPLCEECLSAQIGFLISSTKERHIMGINSRKRQEESFSLDAFLMQFEKLYLTVKK